MQYVFNASLPKWLMAQRESRKIPICSSLTICGYALPHTLTCTDTHIYWLFLTFSFTTPLTPELFCTTFDKHQMFSSSQNDFYGLERRRHGDLGDETQLFTIIYSSCASLWNILLRFLPSGFICPNTPGIIYKGCRNGERRAQSSEIRCRDWCFQECWGRR